MTSTGKRFSFIHTSNGPQLRYINCREYISILYISIVFEFNIQTFTLQMGFRATIHIVFMQSWGRKVQRGDNSEAEEMQMELVGENGF